MGVFSKWGQYRENRQEKKVAKNLKTILNPKAIKEERTAAIDYFCNMKNDEIAVPALLKRFEYSLEHGINDSREKEACLESIIQRGESVVPMIQEHLMSTSRIAWPIKALNRLASEEMLVEVLKSCLDFGEVAFDQAKIDKNYDILCYLLDYSLPGYARELAHFLSYHDERVRFAAVEVLVEQEGDGEVADILEPYLTDVSSENTRIHQAAVEAFVKHKWPIKDKSAVMASPIVNQFKIAKEGFLQPI